MTTQDHIAVEEAAKAIGVTKSTLYYYIRALKLETERFPLDRNAYLTVEDFEKIKTLKDQARSRSAKKEQAA